MNRERIKKLLEQVQAGRIDVEEAADKMSSLPYEDIAFARIDHHRELRLGFPEVIFGQGKSAEKIAQIIWAMREKESNVLVTRLSRRKAALLKEEFPEGAYNEIA